MENNYKDNDLTVNKSFENRESKKNNLDDESSISYLSGNSIIIAIMGHVSVGKTTFVNALCNKKLLPTTSDENTQVFTNIKHDSNMDISKLYYNGKLITSGTSEIHNCVKKLNENNLEILNPEINDKENKEKNKNIIINNEINDIEKNLIEEDYLSLVTLKGESEEKVLEEKVLEEKDLNQMGSYILTDEESQESVENDDVLVINNPKENIIEENIIEENIRYNNNSEIVKIPLEKQTCVHVEIETDLDHLESKNLELVNFLDTPGFRLNDNINGENDFEKKELLIKKLKNVDVIFFVIDISRNWKDDDNRRIIQEIKENNIYNNNNIFIIMNKIDVYTPIIYDGTEIDREKINPIIQEVENYFRISKDNIIPVSSKRACILFDNDVKNELIAPLKGYFSFNLDEDKIVRDFYQGSNIFEVMERINKRVLLKLDYLIIINMVQFANTLLNENKNRDFELLEEGKDITSINELNYIENIFSNMNEKMLIPGSLLSELEFEVTSSNCLKWLFEGSSDSYKDKIKEAFESSVSDITGDNETLKNLDREIIYRGGLKKGLPHGKGVIYPDTFKNRMNRLEGKFYQGELVEVRVFNNNYLIYDGEVVENKGNGKGMLYQEGNLIYKGTFRDNKLSEGIIFNKEIKVYEGEFVNNLPEGEGKIFTNNNTLLIKGIFFDGKLKEGIWYQKGKIVYDGEFRNWYFNGEGTFYNYPYNKVLYKGKFIDGKISY